MKNIKIDDICKFRFLSDIRLDSKGENACFLVHKVNDERDGYNSNLWMYYGDNNRYCQITNFNKAKNFFWDKDDKHIVFQNHRENNDKVTNFYKVGIDGGTPEKLFEINRKVNSIERINDKLYLFTSTYNHVQENDINQIEGDYIIVDEIPFWNNGSGYTSKNRNRLYIFNVETGKHSPITGEYMDVEQYTVKDDNILFIGKEYKNKMQVENNIFMYNIENEEYIKVSPQRKFSYSYAAFIDNHEIIFSGSDMTRYGNNENHKFFIIDLKTKDIRCITPELEISLWNTVGSDCRFGGSPTMKIKEDKLYFTTSEDGNSYLNEIDKYGNIKRTIENNGSVDSYDVSQGKVIFIALIRKKLQEIYLKSGLYEVQKTNINEWVQKERKITNIDKISTESDLGVKVDGWIMKPVDFEEGKKYPAILNIHGGPKSAFGDVFFHEMQYWSGKGYVVFFCNLRGSNTRDNEYSDIRGRFGTIDYEDIMNFTDAVLEKCPYIDRERLGVTGGSYGGYMTNWIIGHTDRFKAAVSQRCISNWISKFNTTDIGYYWVEDQNKATPWSDVNKLWDHSPIKYANKVKTPTLFIHSDEDYRCYLGEGIQMFTALKYHNVESKLCVFKGANHELSRSGNPLQRIGRLKEITKWFDYYLMK
ncbi:MAG: S9 family peptidase [Tepidibacter sp.]|jgi:dipeptidyl aminopeptidase/acylaminoacyl peptidase|uniref:alpha/beta hydrolase family protein n=1 Tax=Tepidibacter sp. TaxID=2529387 RepID=UPI0025D38EF4|nr:S9 family peptidase [Tepidibacter sp.]MCT4508932.1 S9 family peptidase [Tepidibacter sp.]